MIRVEDGKIGQHPPLGTSYALFDTSMEIKTERLLLREFNDDDWADVLSYQKNPLYDRYYEWMDRTPEAVKDFVRMFIAQQREEPRTKFQLAITLWCRDR